jgi:predicted metalloprotease with PDZ domain
MLARRQGGQTVKLHAFRRDELMEFTLQLAPPATDGCQLEVSPLASALRRKWLGV